MNQTNTYTLEDLAKDFGLTPRTARHYIENVLPPHHKTGRGKRARYGKDTWNCFAFIQKVRQESGFTATQLAGVMAELDQQQIDRVVEGREELRVATIPSFSASERHVSRGGLPRASQRARTKSTIQESKPDIDAMFMPEEPAAESRELFDQLESFSEKASPSWQNLYADDELRVSYKGQASREQREQVELTAQLIKKMLENKE
jgi:DNA-binding transcriptional MerR regulator